MIRLELTAWFRKRMTPMVVLACAALAASAPVAYHLEKRYELWSVAREDAEHAALALREIVQERPRLWRYDAAKLYERLVIEGRLRGARLIITDERGRNIPLQARTAASEPPNGLIWSSASVIAAEGKVASVWVGVDGNVLWRTTATLALVFALAAIALAFVLYGVPARALSMAEKRIAALMRRLTLSLQEEERRRIARDLHDGVGQALTAARLQLLALERGSPPGQTIPAIALHLDEAVDEVRRSTTALLPPALVELGLSRALARHCEAVASATSLSVVYNAPPDLPDLGEDLEVACYRIVQEALSNTAKHAGATWAAVRLAMNPRELQLQIADDGVGISEDKPDGCGLDSIRQRVLLLGGTFSLPRVERGCTIAVTLPLAGGL